MQTLDGASWLPTEDFGEVDRLDTEAVVTSFYQVGIPLWPEHSAYVIRAADGSEQRIRIPLHTRSVVLGYLRAPLWMTTLILAIPAILMPTRWLPLLIPAAVLGALAAVLTFAAGRLAEGELLRRSLLRRVVGFGAPPELLTAPLRAEISAQLELMWRTRSPRTGWVEAIDRGEPAEILVALAEYHQDGELLARAHANLANRVWN